MEPFLLPPVLLSGLHALQPGRPTKDRPGGANRL